MKNQRWIVDLLHKRKNHQSLAIRRILKWGFLTLRCLRRTLPKNQRNSSNCKNMWLTLEELMTMALMKNTAKKKCLTQLEAARLPILFELSISSSTNRGFIPSPKRRTSQGSLNRWMLLLHLMLKLRTPSSLKVLIMIGLRAYITMYLQMIKSQIMRIFANLHTNLRKQARSLWKLLMFWS